MSDRMKPVMILPVGQMTKRDIRELRANGFCIVEAKDPSLVRFTEPPPEGYSVQERAAISLCRVMLASGGMWSQSDIRGRLVQILINGTPLSTMKPAALPRPKKVTT